jgi:hypothetical protein
MSCDAFNDVVGVYLIQLATLDHEFLNQWAERLGITQLLDQVQQEAERFTPPTN